MNYLIRMLLIRSDKRFLYVERRKKGLSFSFNVKKALAYHCA